MWLDFAIIIWAGLAGSWLCWEMWRDYRDVTSTEVETALQPAVAAETGDP
jgi:hypothetical protein